MYIGNSLFGVSSMIEVRAMEVTWHGMIEMDETDDELIERFLQKQDQRAFDVLVLRFQTQLRKYATRLCNGDTHLAEDLVQETFLRAYLSLAGFRGEAKLSTWLHRITFNLSIRHYRKNCLQPKQWCQLEEIAELEDPTQPLEQFEVRRDIAAAMNTISITQQKIISLCVIKGHSHEHIARLTAMPLGTIKTNILRGKIQLKKYLSSWREAA